MNRQDFLKAAAEAGFETNGLTWEQVEAAIHVVPDGEIPRRPYRDDIELSILGMGAIVLIGQEQAAADRAVAASVDRGVNYFDVAPSYGNGEAELKMGPALRPHRDRVFLACKTGQRDAAGAREELEQSLRRLSTDHFDLYQLHGMTSMEEVERVFAADGAMDTFLKAREQGKVRYLGFSAHSQEAAVALLERFAFDSVLCPINFVCMTRGDFGPKILEKAKAKGAARLALKALAYTPWDKPEPEREYPKCWYQPITRVTLAERALRFTLSEDITAAIPPGDERLYELALDLAAGFAPLSAEEREQLLAESEGLEPIFKG